MSQLELASADMRAGRFASALAHLRRTAVTGPGHDDPAREAALAESLYLTGDSRQAKSSATAALQLSTCTKASRVRCLTVLGSVAWEAGDLPLSVRCFQKAKTLSKALGDVERFCWIQLELVAKLADVSGPNAVVTLLEDCRTEVGLVGHPELGARLHLSLAQVEGKRGLLEQAGFHLRAAESLLAASANPWLEGLLFLNSSAIQLVMSQTAQALASARRARACADVSGHSRTKIGALGNLAFLMMLEGNFDEADDLCCEGLRLLHTKQITADIRSALLETRAQIMLARGDPAECGRVLDELTALQPVSGGFRPSWYALATLTTRVRLERSKNLWHESLAMCREGIAAAKDRRDGPHGIALRCLAADSLVDLGKSVDAARTLNEVEAMAADAPLAVLAEVDRSRASLLARTTGRATARDRIHGALRVLALVGGPCARRDAAISYVRTMKPEDESLRRKLAEKPWDLTPIIGNTLPGSTSRPIASPGPLDMPSISDLTPLSRLTSHPQLFAQELFILLRRAGCARALAIVSSRDGRPIDAKAHEGWSAAEALRSAKHAGDAITIPCGKWLDDDLSLVVQPVDELEPRMLAQAIRSHADGLVALETYKREERARSSLWPLEASANEDGVFTSPGMKRLVRIAKQAAPSDLPILITGESGTGKEILARLIHRHSGRARKSFMPYNCTGVPRDMVDSQLFGHRRGAFTGAHENAPGVVRTAAGGTLLLDEIGELELQVQPKLLRFLERNEIHPIGEARPVEVDVRVIAATNADLDQRVQDGRFREDLFFRLNIIRLRIPPLRDRREDIPSLVQHFLRLHDEADGRPRLRMTDTALKCMLLYEWPGNVRQLSNEIRRAVALSNGAVTITPEQLSPELLESGRQLAESVAGDAPPSPKVAISTDQTLAAAVEAVERALIKRALHVADGRVNTAARLLGLSRKGLFLKRRRLGIDVALAS